MPRLQFDGRLQTSPEVASVAVGGLDAIDPQRPDPSLFTYSHIRKEAAFSARIEGLRFLPTL